MMNIDIAVILVALACALLGVAVWTDLRYHRIPNWLVLGVFVTGLGHQFVVMGPVGLAYGFGGLAVGTTLFIGFYARGGMGAGDVKLMGAAGAMFGPLGALFTGAVALIAGLLLVISARYLLQFAQLPFQIRAVPESFFIEKNNATRIPYAPAIAIGFGVGVAVWRTGIS